MQPPPQTVPPGTGGPPPVGGIPRNRYWSNSPYSRRANTPVAPAAGPVQPVTDPFAFGRQTPQGTPLGNQSKGSPLVMQGPSGVFPQPSNTQVPQPHAGDNPLGLHPSLPGPPSQPGVNTDLFTNTSAPSALSGWAANSGAEIHPNTEPGPRNPSVPSHYSSGPGLENSYGGYPQGSVPPPGRPLSRQDPSAPSSGAPTTSSFFPPPLQQTAAQWRPVQGSPPPSLHNYPPFAELPSHSTAPLAPGMSHFHPGAGHQQYVPPVTVSGPPGGGEKREPASDHHPENRFSQTPGATAPWVSQPYPEQFYPPQHLADPSLANPVAQVNSSENQPQYGTEAVLGHGQPEAPSGTFSVFFARGEAKNEENLSLGIAGKSDFDGFPPSSGPGYPHPPHPPQLGAAGLPQAAVVQGSPSEDVQRVVDAPPYFSQPASNQHDTHTAKNTDLYADDRSGVGAAHGSQFENIENLECVQNQEVPPSEPPNLPASSPNELYRYGPATGQPLPKHSVGSHAEGGSNLESPDALPHPIRSESVSSNYSGVSHRSAASSARPQELVGTFIQQEVGKPDEELSGSFFKQIDSSPLGGEICEPSVHKSYHGNLSQPPTPSPPKPTGVFQTSANSSFEPVRAHGVGVKPVEADRANVVAELRENPGTQKNSRPSPALPAASPGNLEQPPDNMETFFMPHGHPLPRPGDPGSLLPHIGGPPLENTPLSSEKRASTRAHAKKCESPATTLWAQNELPNFGGNVLLAPAAPALYVPPKTQASEVIQPPDEGLSHQQARKPGSVPVRPPTDGSVSSENLENPPKMGEEEALPSQVTKDPRRQTALDGTQQGALAPPQQIAGAPGPKAVPSGQPSDPSHPGSQPGVETPPGSSAPPAGYGPTAAGRPQLPPGTGAPAPAVNAGQPSGQQEPPRPPPSQTPQNAFGPPQNLPPYYYYRHPYEAYQPPYPQPYPTDPRLAPHLYQEDAYGLYDPRYRHYDSGTEYPESYRYAEPERPSSRASHSSERPSSRQGYPERYYNTKGGWSSQSDFYANYYSSQYDYGDPSRWERYQYDPRYRDSRYDRRYWYDSEHDPYRKEPYYDDRPEKYEDHWRYDPRFTGSFDDEPEPHRDPYGDELDRRSVHSEHSAHSQQSSHSRQSSFSSRSRQSQIYRNHDVTANSYDATAQPGSHHGDYSYGYSNHFKDAQTFVDYGYPSETGWSATEHVPSRPSTPEKFSVTHVCARFGPGGHLIKVLPNLPSEGQPALVEIHSMETMLQHTPEQEEMRSFPGPLAKDDTHKVDVINFAQNKATECFRNENLLDKESASLLWDFIVLLCRQNGTVVGTDIAELLLRDHKTVWLPGKSPNEANLIDFSNEAVEQAEEEEAGEAQLSFLTDSLVTTTDSFEKETERFRELLLYGRKKDALESAMKHGLWGHALLLASKMDNRTHARVMTRFANSLPINDPLQTVYQLMSGRMPAASTCCGDEKWGDWRPHLAMVLSNLNNNMDVESRTIATMGDTLASKGLLDAAHFCYLMAQVGFGVYTKKTTKLVLIGSNHSWPFLKFASNEAIHRTEAYEYAQSLGSQPCFLPNFQVFKFIYACRLAEAGLAAQAFHYCEVISKTILQQPHQYSPVLISQLIQIASQLRLFDPQIKEKPEQESFIEPAWLVQLQHLQGQIKEGDIIWNPDRGTPQQYPSTPSSELEHYDGPGLAQDMDAGAGNPLLASLLPNLEPPNQNVRLMPSAPQTILDGSAGVAPPLQQENSSSVPFYPGPPSMRPVPGYSPPGSVPGFSDQYGGEPGAVYLGPDGLPGGQSSHAAEQLPEESRSQDPATRRMPQESPIRSTFPDQREDDFSGKLAPGRRSRTTSQSSVHLGQGRRPQNSESLGHSAGKQPSPSASVPDGKRPAKEVKKDIKEPKKGGESWFSRWLPGKKKTEAYLPDDKNKSIVWDEKKQRWVNLDEPEEMSKPPPPPPTSFPKVPQALPPGPAGPPNASVNMFSRKAAGSRARYVDVLNPSGTKPSAPVPAPSDLFAPLAPLPIPSNLFVPNPEEQPPVESGSLEGQTSPVLQTNPEAAAGAQLVNSAASPPGCELPASNLDGSQSGELSRCSSMSSLSREVSQHFNQPACSLPLSGGPPAGTVPFYNPSQFAQPSVAPGSTRLGRIGQRKYPSLK
ncbi:protein transport protein Sec16A isoform X6 [Ornithorhynchus anatinus]|uniref:protein transport protein Sec16A isoform X6 n=1 Tax=Ornithorhynchus anatinus TaxID=9258 RepID=UPI0010A8C3E7|nr:protein transport protein Sec16A isoform X6 [Ornithorhynchus anatinus]